LANGEKVAYSATPLAEGGMKRVHAAADGVHVIAFFREPEPEFQLRIDLLLGRYNPTVLRSQGGAAGSERSAQYFKERFCWPVAKVVHPSLGILMPAFPSVFFFKAGHFAGKEKELRWFTRPKPRKLLPPEERGSLVDRYRVCIALARLVRRLHQAGLAHADLSPKNVLADMPSGRALLLDFDALVVPDVLPPVVLGTSGYVAPEILATNHLPQTDPRRQLPSIRTDEHALAVLIYELLILRHPLHGPKVNAENVEDDERLSMGEKALFIEHPLDRSNAVPDLRPPCDALGPALTRLIHAAFVDGLHDPERRPSAYDWERTLVEKFDRLYPCSNTTCPEGWLMLPDAQTPLQWFAHEQRPDPVCPYCGTAVTDVPRLDICLPSGKLARRKPVFDGVGIYEWDLAPFYPGEEADHRRLAFIVRQGDQWLLGLERMEVSLSNAPRAGRLIPLTHGMQWTGVAGDTQARFLFGMT
jgi:hypothetical protein